MKQKKHLLLVEDNLGQVAIAKEHIPSGWTLDVVSTYTDYKEAVEKTSYDLVITDLFFPFTSSEATTNTIECKKQFGVIYNRMKSWGTEGEKPYHFHVLEDGWTLSLDFKIDSDNKLLFKVYEQGWYKYSAGSIDNLGHYLEVEEADYDVAPFGVKVFWEMTQKGTPVKMVTSDHCHDSLGSLALGYLQQRFYLKDGTLPYSSVRGRDLRLTPDENKPSSSESMTRIYREALALEAICRSGNLDPLEEIIDVRGKDRRSAFLDNILNQ